MSKAKWILGGLGCVLGGPIGALIGVSTAEYNKSKNQPFVWHDKEIDE